MPFCITAMKLKNYSLTKSSDVTLLLELMSPCIYISALIEIYSAEVLKAAAQKSSSGSADASPVMQTRGNIPSSSLLVKKAGPGQTLTPLGPLGLSLREDDSSSTSVRPRRQHTATDAGYSSDELQVLR